MFKKISTSLFLLFSITQLAYSQVANDDCTSAQPITIPSSGNVCINSTNTNALSDNTTNGCDVAPAGNEVWFTYVATGSLNQITITPNGTPINDVALTLYTGGCAGLLINSCANGVGAAPVTDAAGFTPGTQVWISVESESTDGDFELCISSTTPLGNPGNNCATAAPLCRKEPFSYGNLNGYTPSGFQPTCFGSAVQRDIWFKFTVGVTGTLEWIATPLVAQEFDWALYDITVTCPSNGTAPVRCNYYYSQPLPFTAANPIGMGPAPAGADAGEFRPASIITAGRTYALLIDNFSGNNGGFDFQWGGTFKMAPNSSFELTPYQACNSLATSFTNNSIGASTYAWTFGDGTSSNVQNPPGKTYNDAGNYIVSLTTTTDQGCVHTVTKVAVVSAPIVELVTNTDSICFGDSITLTGDISITSFQNPIPFTAIEDANVNDNDPAGYTSIMNVSGVFPLTINPGIGELVEVILNIDHKRVSDLDVSLKCPNGTTIDLTSDNGGTGDNYENTRFVAGAPPITGGVAPFTGGYAPEQAFTNLNGCPVNGNWELIVVDDQNGEQPYFDEWSMAFKNENEFTYSWAPMAGFSNQIDMEHTLKPTTTITYTLSATDALGCIEEQMVTIFVDDTVDAGLDTSLLVCSNGGNLDLSTLVRNASGIDGLFLDPSLNVINPSIDLATSNSGEYKYVLSTEVCASDEASIFLTIAPKPTPGITGDSLICIGNSTTLYASGGSSYQWRPNNETTDSITVASSVDQVYSLIVNNNGCLDSISTTVFVEELPNAGNDGVGEICNEDTPYDLDVLVAGNDPDGTWVNNSGNGVLNTTTGIWNPDGLSEGVYSFDYVLKGANVCPSDTANASVQVWEVPDVTIGTISNICLGDILRVPVYITGSNPPFTMTVKENGTSLTYNNLAATDTIEILVKEGRIYKISKVVSSGTTICSQDLNMPINFLIHSSPTISVDSLSCNDINTEYQVYMSFQSGDVSSYLLNNSVDVSGNTSFTGAPITSGSTFKYWITDVNLCAPVDTIQGIYACGCASFAGSFNSLNSDYCVYETVFASHKSDHVLDANDTLSYVLHDKPGTILGNVIKHSASPVFTFDPETMSFETTYYVVAVAGDMLAGGLVDLSNPNGCLNVSNGLPVVFHDIPTMTMTGDTTICDGEITNLKFTITGKSPYNIDYTANGNSGVFNRMGSGIELVGPLSDSTTYIATKITDGNGCENTSTDQVQVNVNPIPTTILSTNTPSYCFGDSVYLVFTSTGNGPWVIDYTDGANNYTFNTNDFEDSVMVKDVVTTNYTLTQVSDNTTPACVGTTGSSVNFTVNPIPTATLSGSTAICAGTSATINITTSGNADFLITIDDQGVGFVHDTGVNGNSFVVTPNDTTTYTIVNITDGSTPTCSSALTSLVTIAVNPLPTLAVSAINDTICEGDSTMFKLHLTSDGPYDVTYNNGTSNTTINNIDSAYFFYVSPSVNTTYTFNNVTDNDVPAPACIIDPNITKKVVVYKRPTVSLGNDLEICQGDIAFLPYTIDGVNPKYSAYYTLNNGVEQVFTGLSSSGLIAVPNLPSGMNTFQLTRANDSSSPTRCFKPQTASINVQVNQTPRLTIIGDTTLCAGETLDILFKFPTGVPSYDLDLFDGTTITTLTNISTGYVDRSVPTDSTNYSIQNFFDRTNARCAGIWDSIPVTVNVNPNPTVNFTGDDTICIGDNATLYFEGSGVPNFSYDMVGGVSSGLLITSTPNFQRIVSPEVTTTYRVKKMYDGSTRTCTSDNQGEVTIVVRELPTATVSGKEELCYGLEVDLQLVITGYAPFDVVYRNDITGQQYAELGLPKNNTLPLLLEVGSHNFSLVSVQMSDDPYCVADS
ncbi:MAG: subtilisin-like proprotein convertase family protein, partial [Flavobacteriales bacterium]